jgi:uroporphyrinogen-III synthase
MSGIMRRVWVTRALPGAQATAARLSAAGLHPVVAPLIETTALPGSADILDRHDALVFTSAAAVRQVALRTTNRTQPVYAVGEATAQAARSVGWTVAADAAGGVADLARVLAAVPTGLRLLHPCAAFTAGDLSASGLRVTSWPVYRTDPVATGWAPALDDLTAGRLAGVLVQSPSAAVALAAVMADAPIPDKVLLFALSKACAAPLEGTGFREIASPPFPREAALLKVVADTLVGAPPATPARH